MTSSRTLGTVGMGFRAEYFPALIDGHPLISWLELLTENYLDASFETLKKLEALRSQYLMTFHGVSMSLGGIHPLDISYLKKIRKLKGILAPVIISDHLSYSRYQNHNSHDLLPIAYNSETFSYLANRIHQIQDILGCKLYLENPSTYISYLESTLPESTFLSDLCKKTGCGVILDINNLVVNKSNLGLDPSKYLKDLNAESIGYLHLAGHSIQKEVRIDTHGSPVDPETWNLLHEAFKQFGPMPAMIERDVNLPAFDAMVQESSKIDEISKLYSSSKNLKAKTDAISSTLSDIHHPSSETWENLVQKFFLFLLDEQELKSPQIKSHVSSKSPTPIDVGLRVYQHGYLERLLEALEEQIPVFTVAIGRPILNKLLQKYLKTYPPSSYSLDFSLKNFSSFLNDIVNQTDQDIISSEIDKRAFIQLATVEQTLYQTIFDEQEYQKPLTTESLASFLNTADLTKLFQTQFSLKKNVTLLELDFDVIQVIHDFKKSRLTALPTLKTTYGIIYRNDGERILSKIPKWQYLFLKSISISTDFESALQKSHLINPQKIPKAIHCLGYWSQKGVFADSLSTPVKKPLTSSKLWPLTTEFSP